MGVIDIARVLATGGRVFVSGGTGKIGGHLVPRLSEMGFVVRVLSRQDTDRYRALRNVTIIRGDLESREILSHEAKRCDYAFHLAVKQNINDTDLAGFRRTNVDGTASFLEAFRGAGVKKVVNVSSVVVFEASGALERDEKWHLRTRFDGDLYSQTKVEALFVARQFAADLPCVTVFPTAVIDPSRFVASEPTNLSGLQRWIWGKVGGGVPGGIVCSIGSGQRIINYVIMSDLVDGLIGAALGGKAGEEYILGGENIRAAEYLARCRSRLGLRGAGIRIPRWPFRVIASLGRVVPVPMMVGLIGGIGWGDMFFSSKKAEGDFGYKPLARV